jgi:hypothetical protein
LPIGMKSREAMTARIRIVFIFLLRSLTRGS